MSLKRENPDEANRVRRLGVGGGSDCGGMDRRRGGEPAAKRRFRGLRPSGGAARRSPEEAGHDVRLRPIRCCRSAGCGTPAEPWTCGCPPTPTPASTPSRSPAPRAGMEMEMQVIEVVPGATYSFGGWAKGKGNGRIAVLGNAYEGREGVGSRGSPHEAGLDRGAEAGHNPRQHPHGVLPVRRLGVRAGAGRRPVLLRRRREAVRRGRRDDEEIRDETRTRCCWSISTARASTAWRAARSSPTTAAAASAKGCASRRWTFRRSFSRWR